MSFRSAKTALKNPIVELSLELTDPDSSPKPDEQKAAAKTLPQQPPAAPVKRPVYQAKGELSKTYQRYFSVTIDILNVDVCHSPTVNMSS